MPFVPRPETLAGLDHAFAERFRAQVEEYATNKMRMDDEALVASFETAAATSCKATVDATITANVNCHERGRECTTGRGGYKYATVAQKTLPETELRYAERVEGCRVIESLGKLVDSLVTAINEILAARPACRHDDFDACASQRSSWPFRMAAVGAHASPAIHSLAAPWPPARNVSRAACRVLVEPCVRVRSCHPTWPSTLSPRHASPSWSHRRRPPHAALAHIAHVGAGPASGGVVRPRRAWRAPVYVAWQCSR